MGQHAKAEEILNIHVVTTLLLVTLVGAVMAGCHGHRARYANLDDARLMHHLNSELDLTPVLLLLTILLIVLLHLVAPLAKLGAWPWRVAGGFLLVIGVLLNLATDRALIKADTPVSPNARTTTLIEDGVFARRRNPMYLGMLAIIAGLGLLLGSFSPLLVLPVFAVFIQVRFVRAEEAKLAVAFGGQWQAYASRVRRWF